jgi:hypothetical protein
MGKNEVGFPASIEHRVMNIVRFRKNTTFVTTVIGSSMAFIDGTIVTAALPVIQSALGATMSEVRWVIEYCALFLASLLLVGGSFRPPSCIGDRRSHLWARIDVVRPFNR